LQQLLFPMYGLHYYSLSCGQHYLGEDQVPCTALSSLVWFVPWWETKFLVQLYPVWSISYYICARSVWVSYFASRVKRLL